MAELSRVGSVWGESLVEVSEAGEKGAGWGCRSRAGRNRRVGPLEAVVDVVGDDERVMLAS